MKNESFDSIRRRTRTALAIAQENNLTSFFIIKQIIKNCPMDDLALMEAARIYGEDQEKITNWKQNWKGNF